MSATDRIPSVSTTTGAEEALARFAADALDWPAVRDSILPLALSAIGRRSLLELAPRSDSEARRALERAREVQELAAGGEPPLAGVPDPVPLLATAARYRRALDGEDLADVGRVLRLVEDLGHWLAGRRAELGACAALWAGMPDLSPLREALERSLDRKGRVVDDASEPLKRLRRAIAEVSDELDRAMRELANRQGLRGALAEGHAGQVHQRGGRRVLAVRQRNAGQVPGIVHDRSQTGETLFIEPREAVELGNRLALLEADAAREVARILAELTREVLASRAAIQFACERLGELELATISARFARRVGGRPARVPGDAGAGVGLVLRGWRHPLLLAELEKGTLAEVVPVDLRLGADFRLLVLTGPNTGGKTLAIKGAGLAALMTRLGLAIPAAEGTTVPLYDGIVADIGDEQEIQQSLSTFSSHLVRIQAGLARAGADTLVLLDELGGGTDPSEGAALGEAILERLLELGAPTLATTHLGQLKEFGFRYEQAESAHVEFDLETLAPRYAVVIGAPGESRALTIARRLGLPGALVDRAESRLVKTDGEAEDLMHEMRGVRVDAERLRQEAEERLLVLEREQRELATEREHMLQRTAQVEAEAQRVLEERLADSRAWAARARALLPQLERAAQSELAPQLDGLDAALAGASLTDRRRAFLDGLKKGAFVWVPRFRKRCTVTRIQREKRELVVRLGRHEMTVPFDDVTFYESL